MTLVLADTSVWVDHLRQTDARMEMLLDQKRIRMHPYVVGELALGNLASRKATLAMLNAIHSLQPAANSEVMRLVETGRHYAAGVGWTDIHLLASVLLTDSVQLWTRDRRLNMAAAQYGRSAQLHH